MNCGPRAARNTPINPGQAPTRTVAYPASNDGGHPGRVATSSREPAASSEADLTRHAGLCQRRPMHAAGNPPRHPRLPWRDWYRLERSGSKRWASTVDGLEWRIARRSAKTAIEVVIALGDGRGSERGAAWLYHGAPQLSAKSGQAGFLTSRILIQVRAAIYSPPGAGSRCRLHFKRA